MRNGRRTLTPGRRRLLVVLCNFHPDGDAAVLSDPLSERTTVSPPEDAADRLQRLQLAGRRPDVDTFLEVGTGRE